MPEDTFKIRVELDTTQVEQELQRLSLETARQVQTHVTAPLVRAQQATGLPYYMIPPVSYPPIGAMAPAPMYPMGPYPTATLPPIPTQLQYLPYMYQVPGVVPRIGWGVPEPLLAAQFYLNYAKTPGMLTTMIGTMFGLKLTPVQKEAARIIKQNEIYHAAVAPILFTEATTLEKIANISEVASWFVAAPIAIAKALLGEGTTPELTLGYSTFEKLVSSGLFMNAEHPAMGMLAFFGGQKALTILRNIASAGLTRILGERIVTSIAGSTLGAAGGAALGAIGGIVGAAIGGFEVGRLITDYLWGDQAWYNQMWNTTRARLIARGARSNLMNAATFAGQVEILKELSEAPEAPEDFLRMVQATMGIWRPFRARGLPQGLTVGENIIMYSRLMGMFKKSKFYDYSEIQQVITKGLMDYMKMNIADVNAAMARARTQGHLSQDTIEKTKSVFSHYYGYHLMSREGEMIVDKIWRGVHGYRVWMPKLAYKMGIGTESWFGRAVTGLVGLFSERWAQTLTEYGRLGGAFIQAEEMAEYLREYRDELAQTLKQNLPEFVAAFAKYGHVAPWEDVTVATRRIGLYMRQLAESAAARMEDPQQMMKEFMRAQEFGMSPIAFLEIKKSMKGLDFIGVTRAGQFAGFMATYDMLRRAGLAQRIIAGPEATRAAKNIMQMYSDVTLKAATAAMYGGWNSYRAVMLYGGSPAQAALGFINFGVTAMHTPIGQLATLFYGLTGTERTQGPPPNLGEMASRVSRALRRMDAGDIIYETMVGAKRRVVQNSESFYNVTKMQMDMYLTYVLRKPKTFENYVKALEIMGYDTQQSEQLAAIFAHGSQSQDLMKKFTEINDLLSKMRQNDEQYEQYKKAVQNGILLFDMQFLKKGGKVTVEDISKAVKRTQDFMKQMRKGFEPLLQELAKETGLKGEELKQWAETQMQSFMKLMMLPPEKRREAAEKIAEEIVEELRAQNINVSKEQILRPLEAMGFFRATQVGIFVEDPEGIKKKAKEDKEDAEKESKGGMDDAVEYLKKIHEDLTKLIQLLSGQVQQANIFNF